MEKVDCNQCKGTGKVEPPRIPVRFVKLMLEMNRRAG